MLTKGPLPNQPNACRHTHIHKQLHDLANHHKVSYQTNSIDIYTCYFCPKHNKLSMDEKGIFFSL